MSKLLITGAEPRPPPGVDSPPRIEIATFVKDVRQFSLYIQALQRIYDRPQTETASYFQIGGIHGAPYVDWDGSPSGGRGYCVHRTVVFPTWHRPYVVLFEQEVQRIARQIAATYQSDRAAWEKAAADLRQPYWGWDVLETVVPPAQVISMDTVEIIRPDGVTARVPNPFLAFRFPPNSTGGLPPPFNNRQTTSRYPDINGQTNKAALESGLRSMGDQVVESTRRLYSITNFTDFTLGSATTSGLESVHDTVHIRTGGSGAGGSGNMQVVAVAAFDPIFYLHHAQVDRVISIWFARHRSWTKELQNLTPFWKTQTTYWVSPDIIDTSQTFNYTNPTGIGAVPRMLNEILDWTIRVSCKQFEIGGSFSVFIFLGDVPAQPQGWLTHPTLAGTFDVFANDTPDECANCRDQSDLVIKGFVHLDRTIIRLRSGSGSDSESLDPDVIVPYLKHKLNWGIQKGNGEVVPIDRLPSLEVIVLATPLTQPVGSDLPIEGTPKYYHEITRGRAGGCQDA